jgi:hypothetical protein
MYHTLEAEVANDISIRIVICIKCHVHTKTYLGLLEQVFDDFFVLEHVGRCVVLEHVGSAQFGAMLFSVPR